MSRPHALVTGGSSGIGLALARRLLAQGMNLSLVARRTEVLCEARAALLAGAPADARVVIAAADVALRKEAERAVAQAVAALGPPRLLVTSAGDAISGRFSELPVAAFEHTMSVHYLGTVYVVKAALPFMRTSGGRIVMIASGAGLIGIYGYAAYSPAKFALRGLAEVLHAELRHEGIGVSIVFPPDTDTPQFAQDARERPQETSMIASGAGVWDADTVAERIVRGIGRGAYAITPGLELTAVYRLGSLFGPLLQHRWARRIARMHRSASELATSKE